MVKLGDVSMRIMHGEVLVKEKWIEKGDVFDAYQYAIVVIWFEFRGCRLVTSEPLQQRLVFFWSRPLEVHLIDFMGAGLVGKWGTKDNCHLVCPADFDVCHLEDHFWLQRCDSSQEGVHSLVPGDVLAVKAFRSCRLLHLGHI